MPAGDLNNKTRFQREARVVMQTEVCQKCENLGLRSMARSITDRKT